MPDELNEMSFPLFLLGPGGSFEGTAVQAEAATALLLANGAGHFCISSPPQVGRRSGLHVIHIQLFDSRQRRREISPWFGDYTQHRDGGSGESHGRQGHWGVEYELGRVDSEPQTLMISSRVQSPIALKIQFPWPTKIHNSYSVRLTIARDCIRKPNFPEMPETSQSLGIYLPSAHHQSLPVDSRAAQIAGVRFMQGAVSNIDVNAQRRGASRPHLKN
ncbi:hypothetical protein DFH08DRAFT_826557 [Mycena albidolilacea]|uniref:Uncharacterized protein n=1 Tax=Mycena albidolilacea TaxID=1033008 RepID=A0AAD6Z061_9AGAR|nr:hypothetical protein DFH08DRAFT_826557 [Mycena albidolilacea]